MTSTIIFWMQMLSSIAVASMAAIWFVWPALARLDRKAALTALLFVQMPRYVGMVLLVPHMVDPALPKEFLSSAAYGDLLEAVLAFTCVLALRSSWRAAIPLVWVTNTWGFVDLLNGLRGVIQLNVPSFDLGTSWYIYIFYAPVVVVAHILTFAILPRSKSWKQDDPKT